MKTTNPGRKIAIVAIAFILNAICCSLVSYLISQLGPDTTYNKESGETITVVRWTAPFIFILYFTVMILGATYILYYLCLFVAGKKLSLTMKMILGAVAFAAAFLLILNPDVPGISVRLVLSFFQLLIFGASIPLFNRFVAKRMDYISPIQTA